MEVCYLEERPESDEGPFLKEERSLIDAIAEQLGRVIEHRRSEEALREQERRLASVEALRQTLVTLSHHINNAMTGIVGNAELYGLGRVSADELVSVCMSQAKRISAVLSALRKMVEEVDIRTVSYVGLRDVMLDIEEELRSMLNV